MFDTEGLIMIKIIVSLRQVNKLSTSVPGTPTFTSRQLPSKYTGELVGVEYLYQQSWGTFATKSEDLDKEIDEGFSETLKIKLLIYHQHQLAKRWRP